MPKGSLRNDMPAIPAFCDTCGTAFASGIWASNATNITFSNTKAGPCPKCGGSGHVLDGRFNFLGETIEVLSAPERTHSELRRLHTILRDAAIHNRSADQVAAQIKAEVPAVSALAKYLPKDGKEFRDYLLVAVALIKLASCVPSHHTTTVINNFPPSPPAISGAPPRAS
jgi:hypothetical protein